VGVRSVDSVEEGLLSAPQAGGLNDLFISAHGFGQGMGWAGDKWGRTHRTIHYITLTAISPVAGIDVKDDFALDAAGAHDAVLKALSQDMGAVDRPVFRHHEMGIHMGKAPRTNGPQMVNTNNAWHTVGVERFEELADQLGIFFIQEAASSMPHQPEPGPPQIHADEGSDQWIEPGDAGQAYQ
jgi:hypothetical protein